MSWPLMYSRKLSHIILFIVIVSMTLAFRKQKQTQSSFRLFTQHDRMATDTLPDICTVLPGEEIAALMPFTNPLSKSFPEPDPIESYRACLYQFWKKNDFPAIKVSLLKYLSKEEALVAYKWNLQGYLDPQLTPPERLFGLGDSAFFGSGSTDPLKCDECALVAISGVYQVIVAYKGQFEESPMLRKKLVAIKILELMFDRIPGLAPSRIRNRQ